MNYTIKLCFMALLGSTGIRAFGICGKSLSKLRNKSRRDSGHYESRLEMSESGSWLRRPSILDFRSDTLTQPTMQMRKLMSKAEIGDDVFGEDPTVNKLETEVAALLGKESSLFVPSGTMANLISQLVWCNKRGSEIIIGDQSHMFLCEQANGAQFGGIGYHPLPNLPDGTIDIDQLAASVRLPSILSPASCLIAIENTHNQCGGRVLTVEYMNAIGEFATNRSLKLHVDGARIWNAAAALNVQPSDLVKYADSVSICFSKGLAAPVGSALCGSFEFINKARLIRKALGGGMRQSGILAAAARESIRKMLPRIADDHVQAKALAVGISELNWPDFLLCNPETVETNIVIAKIGPKLLEKGMYAKEFSEKLKKRGILVLPVSETAIRFVTYYQITPNDIKNAIEIIRKCLSTLAEAFTETSYSDGVNAQLDKSNDTLIENTLSVDGTVTDTKINESLTTISALKMTSETEILSPTEIHEETGKLQEIFDKEVEISNEELDDGSYSNYEEMEIAGMAVSNMGFVTVLSSKVSNRALIVPITPADPMSAGLDTQEPGTPEALTLLQLMQGIDMDFYLPLETLAKRMKTRAVELESVYFHEVDPEFGGASLTLRGKSSLVNTPVPEPIAFPEFEAMPGDAISSTKLEDTIEGTVSTSTGDRPLEYLGKCGFEGIALALRYTGSRIFVNPKLLQGKAETAYNDEENEYYLDMNEIELRFPSFVWLREAQRKQILSDAMLESDNDVSTSNHSVNVEPLVSTT